MMLARMERKTTIVTAERKLGCKMLLSIALLPNAQILNAIALVQGKNFCVINKLKIFYIHHSYLYSNAFGSIAHLRIFANIWCVNGGKCLGVPHEITEN